METLALANLLENKKRTPTLLSYKKPGFTRMFTSLIPSVVLSIKLTCCTLSDIDHMLASKCELVEAFICETNRKIKWKFICSTLENVDA